MRGDVGAPKMRVYDDMGELCTKLERPNYPGTRQDLSTLFRRFKRLALVPNFSFRLPSVPALHSSWMTTIFLRGQVLPSQSEGASQMFWLHRTILLLRL